MAEQQCHPATCSLDSSANLVLFAAIASMVFCSLWPDVMVLFNTEYSYLKIVGTKLLGTGWTALVYFVLGVVNKELTAAVEGTAIIKGGCKVEKLQLRKVLVLKISRIW